MSVDQEDDNPKDDAVEKDAEPEEATDAAVDVSADKATPKPPLVKKKKWEIAKEKRELAEKLGENEEDSPYRPPLTFPQRFKKKKDDEVHFPDIRKR